jgi:flagellar L-ring protein precursor FlgH
MPTSLYKAAFLLFVAAFVANPVRAQMSVFADPTAGALGDLLTVVLVERTSASRQSNWNNQSNSGLGGSAAVNSSDLSGKFAVDASFNKQARNRNSSSQEDLLQGTITARVIEVDATGNLVIEGERKLSVNGETHLLRVSGIVRPIDIRSNNSVLSPDIANADIEYRRGGIHRRFFSPALFVRAGAVVVLAAAVLLGS